MGGVFGAPDRIFDRFRETEVQELDRAFGRDLDVGGLQIAMNHAPLVRVLQRLGDLPRVFERRLDRQRACERLAFDQFHGQGAFFHAIDGGDVGMVQRSQ